MKLELFDLDSQLHQFNHILQIGPVVEDDSDATADFGFFGILVLLF